MSKRKKERIDPSPDEGPINNPFGALAKLKDTAPTQPVPEDSGEPNEAPAVTFAPKVVLAMERKGRGGKRVTLMSGLLLQGAARAALLKELARSMGVRVWEEGEAVLLAGDQRERLVPWLEQRGARRVVSG